MTKSWFLLIILAAACTGRSPDLPGFDEQAWQDDKNGCDEVREDQVADLRQVLDEIRGMSENEVLKVLGTPDQNELYKRNQKFYYYHISPAPDCGTGFSGTPLILEIRFSATNRAKEILIMESQR